MLYRKFRVKNCNLSKLSNLNISTVAIFVLTAVLSSASCNSRPTGYENSGSDTIFYECDAYSVFSNSVIDTIYGGNSDPSYIPNDTTIFSPVRIIPEGKTVVLDTLPWWHPASEIRNFPKLVSRFASVNAAYNVALDILYRCSSGEFMRYENEKGLWQAGFRRGEGYGVWTRDVSYIGILSGSLIDRQVAKRSIEYVSRQGIDNGEDGMALPAIAVWNHFIVTGDSSIISDTYENLKVQVSKIRYDDKRNLGFALAGSLIDNGPQPEAGGFPLSSNILFAEAYKVMAFMGEIMHESPALVDLWRKRSGLIKAAINRDYWDPEAGYYMQGPKGSVSFDEKHWQNLGVSLAIWPMWGIADEDKRRSVLNNCGQFYNQYGFTDLNYERQTNELKSFHGFQIWIFTEVGEMVAMAREQRAGEVLELLSSVIRTVCIHKTFQECIDWRTGKAWRFPGQLWHAMGYISMIYYGVLGMEIDPTGMTFPNACVPKPLAGLRLENLKYRDAQLDIQVSGYGGFDRLLLDGKPVTAISPELKGKHKAEIILK